MADVGLDVDQFAQTRGDDDLFDDEIIPISTTDMAAEAGEDVITQQMEQMELQQQIAEPVAPDMSADPPAPVAMTDSIGREQEGGYNGGYRSRGSARGNKRGRGDTEMGREGRGRRGGGKNYPHAQKTQPSPTPPTSQGQAQSRDNEGSGGLERGDGAAAAGEGQDAPSSTPEAQNSGGNDKEEARDSNGNENDAGTPKVQSVRGDRSATGGIKKPKLTEEELSERMAAAKLRAAERSAAHARAEADEAKFQERERVAQEKRRAENQNRRVLETERERNRMRKLGAQTGREWDAEKTEEDYTQRNTRGSAFRRGAHGGVVDDRPPAYSTTHNDPDVNQYRGRGIGRGRGRGGGHRGGRGGLHRESNYNNNDQTSNAAQPRNQTAPAIGADNEFPSLPQKATASATVPATSAISTSAVAGTAAESGLGKSPLTPLTPQGSWAEQVESSQNDAAKSDPTPYQPPGQAAT